MWDIREEKYKLSERKPGVWKEVAEEFRVLQMGV